MMNLLDDPWIPVRIGGIHTEVSGREALSRAHEIEQLAVTPATMLPVILRQFLLPIVLDALGAPRSTKQWRQWMRAAVDGTLFTGTEVPAEEPGARGRNSARVGITAYLRDHHERFELFHPHHPFAQVAGLRTTKGEVKSSSLLVPSITSGNSVPLFSARVGDEPLPLTPAQAARWLLHTHCWDTAGIKTGAADDDRAKSGKTTGNLTGPLGQLGVVVPVGRTLAETLMLNVPRVQDGLPDGDRPQWRRDPWTADWAVKTAAGRLELLTWQSRRIRLQPEDTPDGPRVTGVLVCAGDRPDSTPEFEPHTMWRQDPKAKPSQPTWRPRRHMSGRAAWRGLDGLLAVPAGRDAEDPVQTSRQLRELAEVLEPDFPLQVLTTGIEYGTQSAVVENFIADSIPLPVVALTGVGERATLLRIAEQADLVARALNGLSADLRRTTSSEALPWDKGQRPGDRLLHAVDPYTRLVLGKLQRRNDEEAIDAVSLAWEQVVWREAFAVAKPLLDQASPRQFAGITIEHKGKSVTLCSPRAELTFRRTVREVLPLAAAARGTGDSDQEN
ncbi:type I-E CRISPR-associated protein Cse1/CasA [Actinosynnema sp. NPDC020468]|uniref:type I-E CRISPR-associated protein Cse1/CasA n=1 Tax=Actinosynnema sp. NPDC020468 TaxID=3154488 RepID=UPI0033E225A3